MMLPRSPRPRQRAFLDDVVGAARVHEHRRAELGRLGPEGIVLGQREVLVVVAADRRAAHPEPLHGVLELLRGEVGILQRDRRERHEPIGIGADDLRQPLVVRAANARRELAVGLPPPEPVDAQRLHIDAGLVHLRDARRADDLVAAAAAVLLERRALDDVLHGHDAVGVDVDDADAAAADRDLAAAARRRLCQQPGYARPPAAQRECARRRPGDAPEEVPAIRHVLPP